MCWPHTKVFIAVLNNTSHVIAKSTYAVALQSKGKKKEKSSFCPVVVL